MDEDEFPLFTETQLPGKDNILITAFKGKVQQAQRNMKELFQELYSSPSFQKNYIRQICQNEQLYNKYEKLIREISDFQVFRSQYILDFHVRWNQVGIDISEAENYLNSLLQLELQNKTLLLHNKKDLRTLCLKIQSLQRQLMSIREINEQCGLRNSQLIEINEGINRNIIKINKEMDKIRIEKSKIKQKCFTVKGMIRDHEQQKIFITKAQPDSQQQIDYLEIQKSKLISTNQTSEKKIIKESKTQSIQMKSFKSELQRIKEENNEIISRINSISKNIKQITSNIEIVSNHKSQTIQLGEEINNRVRETKDQQIVLKDDFYQFEKQINQKKQAVLLHQKEIEIKTMEVKNNKIEVQHDIKLMKENKRNDIDCIAALNLLLSLINQIDEAESVEIEIPEIIEMKNDDQEIQSLKDQYDNINTQLEEELANEIAEVEQFQSQIASQREILEEKTKQKDETNKNIKSCLHIDSDLFGDTGSPLKGQISKRSIAAHIQKRKKIRDQMIELHKDVLPLLRTKIQEKQQNVEKRHEELVNKREALLEQQFKADFEMSFTLTEQQKLSCRSMMSILKQMSNEQRTWMTLRDKASVQNLLKSWKISIETIYNELKQVTQTPPRLQKVQSSSSFKTSQTDLFPSSILKT